MFQYIEIFVIKFHLAIITKNYIIISFVSMGNLIYGKTFSMIKGKKTIYLENVFSVFMSGKCF